jgi:hypothetical protein
MSVFWHGEPSFTKDSPDMTVPPCGTTGCYAGFVSLRAAPVGTRVRSAYGLNHSRIVLPGQDPSDAMHTEEYATRALGITTEQAGALFFMETIEDVERAVRYLADSPDASCDTLWAIGREAGL